MIWNALQDLSYQTESPVSVISSRWLHRPPGHHNPNYSSYGSNHAEMREEAVLITQKASFKSALCPADEKEECVGGNEGWVTCSMSNVHFSRSWLPNTFQAAYLSSGRREEGRGGCLEDSDYTDSNTQGAFGRSASDGVDDVTAQNSTVALQMQHHGETKAVSQPRDRKQKRPRGGVFSQTGSYRGGQTSITAQHAKQQDCTERLDANTLK